MILLRALYKAAELLARRGVASREADMVLYAMLEDDLSYAEAVKAYADFYDLSCAAVERKLEQDVRAAGRWCGARKLMEDCYQEAVQ